MTTVEERARQAQAAQAAEKYADGARQFPRGPTGSVERAALVQGFKAGARWSATEDRAALDGMTQVLVLYHPATGSYAMPEPDSEAGLHEAVERFARHVREQHPEATDPLTVHRFYAPSWEAWRQVMGPLEVSAQSMPLLAAMNPDLRPSGEPTP
jgi:hypothetical protein